MLSPRSGAALEALPRGLIDDMLTVTDASGKIMVRCGECEGEEEKSRGVLRQKK